MGEGFGLLSFTEPIGQDHAPRLPFGAAIVASRKVSPFQAVAGISDHGAELIPNLTRAVSVEFNGRHLCQVISVCLGDIEDRDGTKADTATVVGLFVLDRDGSQNPN